jgi:hypothetical protein
MTSSDVRTTCRLRSAWLATAALALAFSGASCNQDRAPTTVPVQEADDEGATVQHAAIPVAHPLWAGRLTGEARQQRQQELIDKLKAANKGKRDLKPIYAAYLDDLGVNSIVTAVEGVGANCHPVLHDLGELIAARTNDLELSFALCGDACTYSCIHGAVRGMLARSGDATRAAAGDDHAAHSGAPPNSAPALKTEVTELCRADSTLVPDFFRGNCAHAVGHALAVLAPDMVRASADCAVFDAAAMQHYCQSGVFMELEDRIMSDLHADKLERAARIKAATRFCTTRLDRPSSCLRFLLGQAKSQDEIRIVEAECAKLEGTTRRGCYNGVGFFGRTYLARNPKEIDRFCTQGSLTDRKVCVSGIYLVKKGHSLAKFLFPLCERMQDAALAEVCRDQRKRWYYQLDNPIFDSIFTDAETRADAPVARYSTVTLFARFRG